MSQKISRSYIHIPKTTPISGLTLGQAFNEAADKKPEREMYVFYADQERKTYKQMQEESHQFAGALLKLGLQKRDVLAVWGFNHYEWLVAYLAAMQIGMITVHMRIDFPLETQRQILIKLGIKVLVLTRSPSDLYDRACSIIPELLSNSSHNLDCKGLPLKYVITAGSKKTSGAFSNTEIMNMCKDEDKAKVMVARNNLDIDDIVGVFFTSGTTGFPKGVTHSSKTLSGFMKTTYNVSGDADGRPIPWMSRYALIMSFGGMGAQAGALSPILMDSTTIIVGPTYDKVLLAKAFQDERVTGAGMLIHHVSDIVDSANNDEYDFSSLLLCIAGGSFIPRPLRHKAKKIAKHFILRCGGTEGFMALQSPTDPMEIFDAPAFRPSKGSELKIIGPDEQIVPIKTPGEICYRSDTLFLYYWGAEEKTKEVKRPSGWYHTGDLGTLDENGYLRIVGRKSERIIKEGINIAPCDLEKVLDHHPCVANIMVVGVPDERTSEEVCACVRLDPSAKVTEDELRDFCKGKVSDFLIPKYVIFMKDAFPTTATGKYYRKKLAEQAKSILGL